MPKCLKKLFILILLLILIFNLTGCYDSKGIEEFAYVVAMGIDILEDDSLQLTLQFAQSGGSNSSESSSGSSQSSGSTMTSIKCNSINSGISLINAHISKIVSLSHCQEIIFSEEIASLGISEYIETLANDNTLRTDCSLVISKSTAKDYLTNVKPSLETLTARYYESSIKSNKYTGYTVNVTLADFYSDMKSTYSQPYAILAGINTEKSNTDASINADFTAGNIPITDKDVIENLGIAIFNNDKLVGELTGLDSICHLIITNELDSCILSIPSPFEENKYIDFQITQSKKTQSNVNLIGSSALININASLIAYGLSIDDKIDYGSEETISKLEQATQKYLDEKITNYLYKTSEEYGSDICGFGRFEIKKHLTLKDWYNVHWLENYKYSSFDVNVDLTIKSGNIFTKM